ncbi:glycosyltransferase family 1 protein [Polynucleobacter sp. MWH-Jannik1A5]|uniref:glycosyltransferase family 4 protein n=1 Tax=Polynucleobacter sp. MWH-Jannik1A5 TaxID=1855890 RepID=UPI001C0C24B6|nr:glycosyltransferase family 1 protein [Polynucleobacter sp. MWH-Jannik1A5]MBU3546716.1 glycosyltransferase family 4 protein [Polynucleobacter sp. MWH-Jannik1A5]
MKIAIDAKNLALYGGGISHWVSEFLPAWIESSPENHFSLVTPRGEGLKKVDVAGAQMVDCRWPLGIPRQLRHPVYDNWIFPKAIKKIKPDFIFSPYFDVRMPPNVPYAITIHDLCFIEVGHLYPSHLRNYYLYMMRVNLAHASHVITVSNTTRLQLIKVLGVSAEKISVIPNALDKIFLETKPSPDVIRSWREKIDPSGNEKLLLYPGGIEYRKNISGLMAALRIIWSRESQFTLLITGEPSEQFLGSIPKELVESGKILFLGRLSQADLRLAYSSVDAVIYPTFSEGFGRVCLEAMGCGTPLACSDLAVLREVAGDYPVYFDPHDSQAIADAIMTAANLGPQPVVLKEEFTSSNVRAKFINEITRVLNRVRGTSLSLNGLQ